jgi:arylamine N-acetyltransferase
VLPEEIRSLFSLLSQIPYENLSKAVGYREHQQTESELMKSPEALLLKHRKEGAGGTCFSLTWYLCNHLRRLGKLVYPVMCDRSYGKDTHCCAILEYEGNRYLLDPGYLAFTPLKLNPEASTCVETVYNSIRVSPKSEGRFALETTYQGERKYRFTLKDEKISEEDFFRCWRASFEWASLTYPVVTMLKGDAHLYFQKEHLYVRRRSGSEKTWVPPEKMPEVLKAQFGISEALTKKALEVFF